MNIQEVVQVISNARANPVQLWPMYNIATIPFAVYDKHEVAYIGHPNPPEIRPQNLMAATAVEINGTQTATIPVEMCDNPAAALPLAYHEGFHVFQRHNFTETAADMFTAMAFYPDLDAEYRALCRLETAVLNRADWTIEQKLKSLGSLTVLRRNRLTHHESLLAYERYLERNEGTALYAYPHCQDHELEKLSSEN